MYGMLHGPVGYSSSFRIDLVGTLLGEGCGSGAWSDVKSWDFCIYIVHVKEVVVTIVCHIVYQFWNAIFLCDIPKYFFINWTWISVDLYGSSIFVSFQCSNIKVTIVSHCTSPKICVFIIISAPWTLSR